MKKFFGKPSLVTVICFAALSLGQQAFAGSIPEITEAALNKMLQTSDKPVVVDFFATWCGPCRHMEPVLEGLAKNYQGKVSFARVDVDKNQALGLKYQISSIPAIFIFKNGRVVDTSIGLVPAQELGTKIDAAVNPGDASKY